MNLFKKNITRNLPRKYEGLHQYQENFRALVEHIGDKHKERQAFVIKENKNTYKVVTFEDFRRDVRALALILKERDYLEHPIAVIGKNSYPWMLVYFATLYAGGVIVPLDKALKAGEGASSFKRSYSHALFLDEESKELLEALKSEGVAAAPTFMNQVMSLVEEGIKAMDDGKQLDLPDIDPDKHSVILFTSGTTSQSKAVLLSQKNILINAYDAITTEPFTAGQVSMAFLPYHHTFGSTGQVVMLWAGVATTYCDGIKYIQKNLVEYKVNIFVGVPLLVESMYKKILLGIKKEGKEKAFAKGLIASKALLKVGIDRRRLIFKDVIAKLGGNLTFIITGASAVDPKALQGLNDIGITTVQGYGLTESAPILSAETPEIMRMGSVGKAMPSVEIKLIDVNEEGVGQLIARGPNIMGGYFENPEDTAKALKDGWLYTGDLASIDKDGFIFIRGREKNVIVLKNGKNVYPEELESLMEHLDFVDEVMVYGEPKTAEPEDANNLVVSCKVVYNKEVMEQVYMAGTHEEISKVVHKAIDKINSSLPEYKHILRIKLTDVPMIKTSTGKVKRFEEVKR